MADHCTLLVSPGRIADDTVDSLGCHSGDVHGTHGTVDEFLDYNEPLYIYICIYYIIIYIYICFFFVGWLFKAGLKKKCEIFTNLPSRS